MLKIYHSNHLDVLETIIKTIIQHEHLNDPFQSEIILIENTNMAQRLKISLAQKLGVATNILFLLPSNFIWNMFVRIIPETPKQNYFEKQTMTWKLMEVLPKMLQYDEFCILRHYLNNDQDKRKLFQLTSKIATLYDRYLIYRPNWINYWEAGKKIQELPKMQIWQALLWKRLVRYTIKIGQSNYHSASLYKRFTKTLNSISSLPNELPTRIFICGISTLPPLYLKIFNSLGKHIDIHILHFNPCRYYWHKIYTKNQSIQLTTYQQRRLSYKDTTSSLERDANVNHIFGDKNIHNLSNPLLESWGTLGQDYIYMLSNIISSKKINIDAFVNITSNCLLHNLQRDILELKNNATSNVKTNYFSKTQKKKYLLDPEDHSISIHVCHSEQREIEVLHDNLLEIMESDSDITPRDIIVMAANIDQYIPFIQSIFGGITDERYIPYSISNNYEQKSNPVIQAFIKIISLLDSRFISEDILALLNMPVLATRFNINEQEICYLRKWINESGIRWGLDDHNVQELELPATGQHTWKFGLARMLLGYAMHSEQGEWNGILPYETCYGSISELVGHLASFLMQLQHWQKWLMKKRKLEEWRFMCRNMFNDFFVRNKETKKIITLIEQTWQNMIDEGIQSYYNESVSFSLLRDEMIRRLDQKSISQNFLRGSVNICELMLMRPIPFKVICLLGMNNGIYPRESTPLGFDLMHYKPRRGDRNHRDDDRYLFLETLVSAKKKLYISYIGYSIQDNSKRLPSLLVQELMNYIEQSHYLLGDETKNCNESEQHVRNKITFYHSRMPFDPSNYIKNKQQSYAKEWLPAAKKIGIAHSDFIQELDDLSITNLPFEKLQQFWKHPVRAFFQMRLKINFSSTENNIPDTEPFTLDGLNRYLLNKQLLNALIKEDTKKLFQYYRASGKLPYGVFGNIVWEAQLKEISALVQRVIKYYQPTTNQEIDLKCDGVQLTGWLKHVQPNGLLRWQPTIFNISQGLQLWLEHLVYCACGGKGDSRLLVRKEKEWHFSPLNKKQALYYLSQFIKGYKHGMKKPLLLLPESAGAWIKVCYDSRKDKILTDKHILKKAKIKFFQRYEGNAMIYGEKNDIWYQRLWETLEKKYFEIILKEAKRYLIPLYKFNQS